MSATFEQSIRIKTRNYEVPMHFSDIRSTDSMANNEIAGLVVFFGHEPHTRRYGRVAVAFKTERFGENQEGCSNALFQTSSSICVMDHA